jgi:hypothetical protein
VHEPSHDPDEPAHHHQQPADPRLDPCTRATDLSFPEGVKRVERCGGVESGEGRTRDGADGDVDGGDGGEGARGWRYQCSPPPLSTLVLAIWPSDLGLARVHCWAWILCRRPTCQLLLLHIQYCTGYLRHREAAGSGNFVRPIDMLDRQIMIDGWGNSIRNRPRWA